MRTFVKTKIVEYYQCTDCEAKFPTLGVAKKHKCSGAVEAQNSTSTNKQMDAIADLNYCLEFNNVPQTVRDLIIRARDVFIGLKQHH